MYNNLKVANNIINEYFDEHFRYFQHSIYHNKNIGGIKMSITKRDRYVVNILDNHIKCATALQINMLPCFGKAQTVASRRLKMLKDNEYLQRQMYEIIGNSYVYYSTSLKYPPKELEHSLTITDVYIALLRSGYEILTFDVEKGLHYQENYSDKYIIPDIMITAKDSKGRVNKYFCEICLDRNIDHILKKYNKYKYYYIPQISKIRKTTPNELLIVSPIYRELEEGYCIQSELAAIENFFFTMSI